MRLMRSVGLTVETFGSGAEFLQSLETRLPDCVVLDLHMPHMDGFNVQTHLARKCAALPVIIVTGHDFPKARERAMAGGASAFLRKPVHDRPLPRLPARRMPHSGRPAASRVAPAVSGSPAAGSRDPCVQVFLSARDVVISSGHLLCPVTPTVTSPVIPTARADYRGGS